ncbi:hypothetical protein HUJ05_000999 [Dendroctonus ponderosae]|nr:hypothetical protein HUJ05_000999 [Dendroctonus ponderosae]
MVTSGSKEAKKGRYLKNKKTINTLKGGDEIIKRLKSRAMLEKSERTRLHLKRQF